LIGSGVILLLGGISGIYGSLKHSRCFLFIYFLLAFIFMLVFAAIAIAVYILVTKYLSQVKDNNCSPSDSEYLQWLPEAD